MSPSEGKMEFYCQLSAERVNDPGFDLDGWLEQAFRDRMEKDGYAVVSEPNIQMGTDYYNPPGSPDIRTFRVTGQVRRD